MDFLFGAGMTGGHFGLDLWHAVVSFGGTLLTFFVCRVRYCKFSARVVLIWCWWCWWWCIQMYNFTLPHPHPLIIDFSAPRHKGQCCVQATLYMDQVSVRTLGCRAHHWNVVFTQSPTKIKLTKWLDPRHRPLPHAVDPWSAPTRQSNCPVRRAKDERGNKTIVRLVWPVPWFPSHRLHHR